LIRNYHIIICLVLTILSCKEEAPPKEFLNVDERLHGYFETFEREAAARGMEIDLNEAILTAQISEIQGEGVAGQCSRPVNSLDNDIVIDESFINSNVSNLLKELVIFHELGHCFLQREHREDEYPNGNCISIMRSGVDGCRDNYNSSFRSIYIDELFDPDSF
jgi:hypothetical protein